MSDLKQGAGLPEPNTLVLAYLTGFEEHSDALWKRYGYALMVRHGDDWSDRHMQEARMRIGATHLDVVRWWHLPPAEEPGNG